MSPNFLILIPVYNNDTNIISTINNCLEYTSNTVLVVDDGSTNPVQQLFLLQKSVASDRIKFLRHEKNLGKGLALQSGFKYAIKNGYTHVITIDGDGQHEAQEISKFILASIENPFALIVGDRQMQAVNIPKASKVGKAISNYWVKYQTNVKVADSQSGFRCYPMLFVQNKQYYCSKYDFEIEILIRLIWADVSVKNIPISVIYPPASVRTTHFHKFKDNFRLTLLNALLVLVSLITEQTSPFKSAMAFALGVTVGVLPAYGLHTGIIFAIAFFLRLNFVYLFIGSQISLPPFIPILIYGSQKIGKHLSLFFVNIDKGFAFNYLVGSVILGVALGIITFFSIYYFKKRHFISKKSWTGKDRNKIGIAALRFLLKYTGIRVIYFILYFVTFYYFLFSLKARKAATQYWQTGHVETNFFVRQFRVYSQLLIFAQCLVDRAYQKNTENRLFDYQLDASAIEFSESIDQKKGVVIVSSHIGGWELAMTFFSKKNTKKKITFVMHQAGGQSEHHSVNIDEKQNNKIGIIYYNNENNTILKIKQQLETGEFVGLMADRPVSKSFEQKLFFGKLACFDTTAFRLAIACESEMRFIFSFKVSLFNYKLFAFKPSDDPQRSKEERINLLLEQYILATESLLKRYPEQWFNFFPFWSTPPNIT